MTAPPELTDQDRRTLGDIVHFSQIASRLVARGKSAYDRDEMLPLAAEAVLHRIGEAVSRLPETLPATHPQVRWRLMRGMRNLIAHQYEVVDPAIVWNTLSHELPVDAAAIEAILEDSGEAPGAT